MLRADYDDSPYASNDNLRRIRHDYFRRLISGSVKDA